MKAEVLFATGVVIAAGIPLLAVVHLRKPLLALLIDVCGTEDRARFWQSFTNVAMVVVPLIPGLRFDEQELQSAPLTAIVGQAQGALIGLIITMCVLGLTLYSSIERIERAGGPRPTKTASQ